MALATSPLRFTRPTVSEPEPRPSWMPSDERILAVFGPELETCLYGDRHFKLRSLIERTGLRAQIEALESWYDSDADDEVGAHLEFLRARLAALEGA